MQAEDVRYALAAARRHKSMPPKQQVQPSLAMRMASPIPNHIALLETTHVFLLFA